jgi:hypothetical protein
MTIGKNAMTVRVVDSGRVLGFDAGDWSMLVLGFLLAALLVLFI